MKMIEGKTYLSWCHCGNVRYEVDAELRPIARDLLGGAICGVGTLVMLFGPRS
jgi:hypothetical protein